VAVLFYRGDIGVIRHRRFDRATGNMSVAAPANGDGVKIPIIVTIGPVVEFPRQAIPPQPGRCHPALLAAPLRDTVLLLQFHQQIHFALVTRFVVQSVNDATRKVPATIAIWANLGQAIGMFSE